MVVIHRSDAQVFDAHGSRFSSYVAPSRGSTELCAWRLEVPANTHGVPHRPTREEVLLVLTGELQVTLDGNTGVARSGDVVLVPAGGELCVNSGSAGVTAWVVTSPLLEVELPGAGRFRPPWAA